jgi:hypothetical protein
LIGSPWLFGGSLEHRHGVGIPSRRDQPVRKFMRDSGPFERVVAQ